MIRAALDRDATLVGPAGDAGAGELPGGKDGMLHYIAVNGRTGETMGSVPIQRWKMMATSFVVGIIVEAIAIRMLALPWW